VLPYNSQTVFLLRPLSLFRVAIFSRIEDQLVHSLKKGRAVVYVNLQSLVGKLNGTCRSSLESAADYCRQRTHYQVAIEHWLFKLSEKSNTDLRAVLEDNGLDFTQWTECLSKRIDGFKTGNCRPAALSPHVVDWIRSAWLVSSVDFRSEVIRSGHLLLALLSDESLLSAAPGVIDALSKISPVALLKELPDVVADTCESREL
jgi:type VI secretion system protein VasG